MLEVSKLCVNYGPIEALHGVSFAVSDGMTMAILGANGAGKTTLLRALSGLGEIRSGKVSLHGRDITYVAPHRRAQLRITHAMEGRRIFRDLTVEANLKLAWSFGARVEPFSTALAMVYRNFPVLQEKAGSPAGLLSGGQQQMAILSAATIAHPKLLLLDEPSLGLAPVIVERIYKFIDTVVQDHGMIVLIAEQMAALALKASSRAVVLRGGAVAFEGDSATMLEDGVSKSLSSAYL